MVVARTAYRIHGERDPRAAQLQVVGRLVRPAELRMIVCSRTSNRETSILRVGRVWGGRGT
eukprot:5694495-Prymnesium_polylepis.1